MTAFREIWTGLDWSKLLDLLLRIVPALLCITFHELSHGFLANRLGDHTAKQMGRLSLNPLRHIDLVGLLMMVVFRFGWAKPVPVNMRNFKNPKRGMAITAAAGPISNLLLAVVFLFVYGLLFIPLTNAENAVADCLLSMLYYIPLLSIYLAIFNVLPIPPLDGSKVLFSLISDEHYNKLMRYEKYGMILLVVVALSGALNNTLGVVTAFVFEKMYNAIAYLGYRMALLFV